MSAYLTDHKPVRDQWYAQRNRPLTGCTVLHTSEGVMDIVGPDTGTDTLAEFIRTRTTAGSYHDVADSDSNLQLVEYVHGAYHDGTGSNNWALSISFVCRTVDWDLMTPERRRGFLRQGALAFARQQAYRRSIGAPLTELRLISKAQSDRGESGFIYHGLRDPGRRTDPGVAPPNDFPFAEFIAECRAVLGQPATPAPTEEPDLDAYEHAVLMEILERAQSLTFPKPGRPHVNQPYWPVDPTAAVAAKEAAQRMEGELVALRASQQELVATIAKVAAGDDIDVDDLVRRLGEKVDAAIADHAKLVKVQVSVDDADAPS